MCLNAKLLNNRAIKIKSIKLFLLIAIAILLINAGEVVTNSYSLGGDYSVTIHGTSNLHDWIETVGKVTGTCTAIPNSDGSSNLTALSLKMNVRSIQSTEGSIMNNNTYKALKADAHPEIIFTIYIPETAIKITTNEKTVAVKGKLNIAGVTNAVNMRVKVSIPQKGKLAFSGEQKILMTDYGIKPPVALLGTLKTGNEIVLHFKTNFNIITEGKTFPFTILK